MQFNIYIRCNLILYDFCRELISIQCFNRHRKKKESRKIKTAGNEDAGNRNLGVERPIYIS